MGDFPKALQHGGGKEDEALVVEARAHLAGAPALQLVAELLTELRTRDLPWWQPAALRELWPATDRMLWYEDRPDLRQQITTVLTGLVPRSARKKTSTFQAELLDSAIDDGDISPAEFETAFEPRDLAVYGPAAEFWRRFRERMPWNESTPAHQELIAVLLKALVVDKSTIDGLTREPILTPWALRTAIPSKVWHTHMPLDVRAAIDDARLKLEKSSPTTPFHVANELQIAVPKIVTASIPLHELIGVFEAAERAMGVDAARAPAAAAKAEKAAPKGEKAADKPAERPAAAAAPTKPAAQQAKPPAPKAQPAQAAKPAPQAIGRIATLKIPADEVEFDSVDLDGVFPTEEVTSTGNRK